MIGRIAYYSISFSIYHIANFLPIILEGMEHNVNIPKVAGQKKKDEKKAETYGSGLVRNY